MAPINIPEGYVFVPRQAGVPVAAQLLDAADEIKADRQTGVRTVSGGYHVTEEIAEQYQANLPESKDEASTVEADSEKEEDAPTSDETVNDDDDSDEGKDDDSDSSSTGDKVDEVALPDESWTVVQIEEWAASQEPAIEFPADVTKKADKLAFINKPAAE